MLHGVRHSGGGDECHAVAHSGGGLRVVEE